MLCCVALYLTLPCPTWLAKTRKISAPVRSKRPVIGEATHPGLSFPGPVSLVHANFIIRWFQSPILYCDKPTTFTTTSFHLRWKIRLFCDHVLEVRKLTSEMPWFLSFLKLVFLWIYVYLFEFVCSCLKKKNILRDNFTLLMEVRVADGVHVFCWQFVCMHDCGHYYWIILIFISLFISSVFTYPGSKRSSQADVGCDRPAACGPKTTDVGSRNFFMLGFCLSASVDLVSWNVCII